MPRVKETETVSKLRSRASSLISSKPDFALSDLRLANVLVNMRFQEEGVTFRGERIGLHNKHKRPETIKL